MIGLLLKQNIIMLVYMLIGFFLYKKRLFTAAGSGELGKLLLYVIMPVTILKSYCREPDRETLFTFGISFAAAAVALLLSILIAGLFFGKRYGMEHFGASFSNAGFIGIPLVQMVLGEEAVLYVVSFVALLNILQWTYGVAVMTGSRKDITARKLAKNPVIISFVLGMLLFFLPVQLPAVAEELLGTLASMNGPLAMLVLGTYLAQAPIRELLCRRELYACTLVRLLVIPAVTLAVLSLVPQQYQLVKLAVLIVAAAPIGSNVAIFAQLHGKDYTMAVGEVCLSTLGSIATMPLILGIASYIW